MYVCTCIYTVIYTAHLTTEEALRNKIFCELYQKKNFFNAIIAKLKVLN